MVLPKNSVSAEYSSSGGHDRLISLKTNPNRPGKTAITVETRTRYFQFENNHPPEIVTR
jgi:hypothetical protein